MDEQTRLFILGKLEAQDFLLIQLYRYTAARLDGARYEDTLRAVREVQFDMLDNQTPKNVDSLSGADVERVRQHLLHHVERFWSALIDDGPTASPTQPPG